LINRKAQAALEFLMTYGWAILTFLVVIGVLIYSGVLNTDIFIPDQCVLPAGITCVDFEVEASKVIVVLRNNFDESITINRVGVNDKNGGSCFNSIAKDVEKNELTTFVILGCDNGVNGRKLNGELIVTYAKKNSVLNTTSEGNLISSVTGSSSSSSDICQNAENNGLCEGLDLVFGEGYKASCCSNYRLCCG